MDGRRRRRARAGALGRPQDRIDPLTQVTAEHMTITATAADGTVRTVSDVVPNRFWTLTEFTAAVRLANGAAARADSRPATATSTTRPRWTPRPPGA